MAVLVKLCCFLLLATCSQGFLMEDRPARIGRRHQRQQEGSIALGPTGPLYSTTPQKPLYDGTNYTFPDTTTPDGIAEVLEVTFVQGIMQLREGYVDILKMFIAAAMCSFQFGFTMDAIIEAMKKCPNETANRPLMSEELELRETWCAVAYLTLLRMNHFTTNNDAISESIPAAILETYGDAVEKIVQIQKQDISATVSVEAVMTDISIDKLGPMEKAIFIQSLRVATLTLVVVREALEAVPEDQMPPTPPIEGAFE